jgi:hypothetical protein
MKIPKIQNEKSTVMATIKAIRHGTVEDAVFHHFFLHFFSTPPSPHGKTFPSLPFRFQLETFFLLSSLSRPKLFSSTVETCNWKLPWTFTLDWTRQLRKLRRTEAMCCSSASNGFSSGQRTTSFAYVRAEKGPKGTSTTKGRRRKG